LTFLSYTFGHGGKMVKQESFVNQIIKYLFFLMILLIFAQGIFLVSSYAILKSEINSSSQAFLELYKNECVNSIHDMDNMLKDITTQGEDLSKIKGSNENHRSLSSISLDNYIQNIVLGSELVDAIVIYDKNYDVCIDAKNQGITYIQKNGLRDFTSRAIDRGKVTSFQWNFVTINKQNYMYKMLLSKTTAIAIYVRTDSMLKSLSVKGEGNRSIVIANEDGLIGKVWGKETEQLKAGNTIEKINMKNYDVIQKEIVKNQLTLYCYTNKKSILNQTHVSMIGVALVVFAAVLVLLFILEFTKKEIADPMKRMTKDMERIKSGDYESRIDANFHTKEFLMFQETTNQMINEIIGLKIQSYEKKLELQDMELRSIRLQLKPHFFLNALTTISSLSAQNKSEQVRIYIEALSKNVRYMFQAGFHTVSLKEEMKHVNNYFEMQELKYPGCVFYMIDMPEELGEWKIPQMLIHTFIENEYKYAVSMENILTLLIKARKVEYKTEEMLLIEIEDDGKGYPKDVLEYMSGELPPNTENGKRVGLRSVKRMIELMYERDDLLIVENTFLHGCLNKIYIPAVPKHEL